MNLKKEEAETKKGIFITIIIAVVQYDNLDCWVNDDIDICKFFFKGLFLNINCN